jgi:hypothetical protein
VIGMVIFAVLAIAGIGAAGFLYTQQGPMKEEIEAHRAAALEAARAALITVDTNAAVDWATIWPRINATFATLRSESDRQGVRLREMEQELEVAAGLQASLQAAQANAQRSAQQLNEANSQLEAARAESARKIADLENRLAAALKAAEEGRAQAAAALASAAAPAASGAPTAAEGAAPAAAVAAAAAADAAATDEAGDESDGGAPARADVPNTFTFPERRSDLLASAEYDSATRTMAIRLQDGTRIEYPDFPRDLYEDFITVPTFETFYRIKIMGRYPSVPDDKAAVRAHQRRR